MPGETVVLLVWLALALFLVILRLVILRVAIRCVRDDRTRTSGALEDVRACLASEGPGVPLAVERATYDRLKPALLAWEGRYVIIRGKDVAGVYGTFEAALKAGYDRHGLAPFMVKKIEAVDTVHHI